MYHRLKRIFIGNILLSPTFALSMTSHFSLRAITFCILHFAFCISPTQAQDDNRFHSGIIGGISTSQVDGDNLGGYDKVGIKAGVFVNRNFSKPFSIQMELLFIQKGSRAPVNPDDNSYFIMRLNYAEVPVMFRYRFSKKIIAEAGASFATLLFRKRATRSASLTAGRPFASRICWPMQADIMCSMKAGRSISVSAIPSFLSARTIRAGRTIFSTAGSIIMCLPWRFSFNFEK
jgi:hypothetical protein